MRALTLTTRVPLVPGFILTLIRKRRARRLKFKRDNILLDITAAQDNVRFWRGEVAALDVELARLGELTR
jgi:hypothetical protein